MNARLGSASEDEGVSSGDTLLQMYLFLSDNLTAGRHTLITDNFVIALRGAPVASGNNAKGEEGIYINSILSARGSLIRELAILASSSQKRMDRLCGIKLSLTS